MLRNGYGPVHFKLDSVFALKRQSIDFIWPFCVTFGATSKDNAIYTYREEKNSNTNKLKKKLADDQGEVGCLALVLFFSVCMSVNFPIFGINLGFINCTKERFQKVILGKKNFVRNWWALHNFFFLSHIHCIDDSVYHQSFNFLVRTFSSRPQLQCKNVNDKLYWFDLVYGGFFSFELRT